MNSLDAIISISVLLAASGIILVSLFEQNENIQQAHYLIEAKFQAQKCASIIDSIYSNTATKYEKEIKCNLKDYTTTATIEGKTKQSYAITTTENEKELRVKTLDHYTN